MGALQDIYLRIHNRIGARPISALLVLAALWLAAVTGLPRLQLDLSFRPLFASASSEAGPTNQFEAIFGQASGAYLLHILERGEGQSDVDFMTSLRSVSAAARQVSGVLEVLSVTELQVPEWRDGEVQVVPVIDPELFDRPGLLAEELERLAENGVELIGLISPGGRYALVASRLEPAMDELGARRDIMYEVDRRVRSEAVNLGVHTTGVSWVEAAYADEILHDQLIATGLSLLCIILVLWAQFRQLPPVVFCILPTGLAVGACLGVMGWFGLPVTIINSVVPAVVLVLGVADAVHMWVAWADSRNTGADIEQARERMLRLTGRACALTSVTTMAGFLSLLAARLEVIREFGVAVALGVALAWLCNQVLIPILLSRFAPTCPPRDDRLNSLVDSMLGHATHTALARPRSVLLTAAVLCAAAATLVPRLDADQRFNEELPASHPVRVGQELLEREFGGFLGPEVSISGSGGGSLLDADTRARLELFVLEAGYLLDTQSVGSILQILPEEVDPDHADAGLRRLREHPASHYAVRERISPDHEQLAVMLRVGDIGTARAFEYESDVIAAAEQAFGDRYSVAVVGQWWLAQQGMGMIIGDMLRSLVTAVLVVLPILWLALPRWRMFLAMAIANLAPLLLPLSFMALVGIKLRIGTAVVMAIALGIAIDNSLHVIMRLQYLTGSHATIEDRMNALMPSTGRAVIYTTLALVGGFLSMLVNDLTAIREMGLVAAVTFIGALFADLYLLPSLMVVLSGVQRRH